MGWGLHPDWKAAIGILGAGAVVVAPVGSFAWWAGWALLAGGLFWVSSSVTYGAKPWWRTYRKTSLALALASGSALALEIASQYRGRLPTTKDVSVVFIPEQLDSERLAGRVVVSSSAERPLEIGEFRLASSSAVTYGGKPTSVRHNQPGAFPFEQYFWRGATITFEGHYKVNGKPAERAIHAEFYVPPHPRLGDQVQPTNCCDAPKSDFAVTQREDADLVANGTKGCLPIGQPSKLEDGRWNRVRDLHARRIFYFDPLNGFAGMWSAMRGKWHWLQAPLDQTIDGVHQMRYCWHEKNGYMAIEADDNYAIFDVDVGKVQQGELR